ncbi:MAG: hypothetical protein Q9213_004056 [Squamulea squamosa]
MSISTALTFAIHSFEEFVTHVNHVEYKKEDEVPATSWNVQLSRLHTWARNVGNLKSANDSLDTRLRDSSQQSLRKTYDEILGLLKRPPEIFAKIKTDKLLDSGLVQEQPLNTKSTGAETQTSLQVLSQEIDFILKWLDHYIWLSSGTQEA